MKKILGILVFALLSCNISFADNLKVIDGDTIVLNGEKIRFSGIDAPELKQICIDKGQEVFCGILAKKLLIEKIVNKIEYSIIKPSKLKDAILDSSEFGVPQKRRRVIIIGIKNNKYNINILDDIYNNLRCIRKVNKKTVRDTIFNYPKIYETILEVTKGILKRLIEGGRLLS